MITNELNRSDCDTSKVYPPAPVIELQEKVGRLLFNVPPVGANKVGLWTDVRKLNVAHPEATPLAWA